MAVSTSSRNSFAAIGVPSIVSELDLNENGTAAKRALGFKVEDAQGNVYRWVHAGAAVTAGRLVSQDISESGVTDTDNAVIAPASSVTTTDSTVGSRFVEMTLASATLNEYAGGKFIVTDDAGDIYTYGIVGNTATNDPATGNIRIELDRPLVVALDATSDVAILGSRYGNVEGATSTDFDAVGVTMSNLAADDYGWVMTKGQSAVLSQGTTTVGVPCKIGSVAGSVTDALTTGSMVGWLNMVTVVAGDDGGAAGVRFNLE